MRRFFLARARQIAVQSLLEGDIQFPADPGVGRCIRHLGGLQSMSRPVGALFPFGNSNAEDEAGERAKSRLLEAQLFR